MKTTLFQISLALLLSVQLSFGQDYIYNVKYLGVKDGLLGRRVTTFGQDNEGFIWIGTNEGLNRFDGYGFQHFTKKTHQLSSNQVAAIQVSEEGDIWINYRQDQYVHAATQVLDPSTHQIYSLKEKFKNHYSDDLDKAVLATRQSVVGSKSVFIQKKNKQVLLLQPNNNLTSVDENLMYRSHKTGEYWIKDGKDVILLDPSGKEKTRLSYPNYHLSVPTYSYDGNLLIFGLNDKNETALFYTKNQQYKLNIFPISDRCHLHQGVAFVGNTMYIVKDNQLLNFDVEGVFPERPKFSFIDNAGNIWIGTSDGCYLISVKKKHFKVHLKYVTGDNERYDARGIWANEDKLYSFSPKKAIVLNLKDQSQSLFFQNEDQGRGKRSISILKNDKIWIGDHAGKITHFELANQQIHKQITVAVPKEQIWSVLEDKHGKVWIGLAKTGLRLYNPENERSTYFTKYNGFDELEKSKIVQIVQDKKNSDLIWIGAQSGWYLAHIDNGILARFSATSGEKHQIPTNDVYYTYQDDLGVYWLGTTFSGLLRVELNDDFTIKSVYQFSTEDGLSSNTIYAIFEELDNSGNLWMSSNDGIMKFNKRTHDINTYFMEDGLNEYEFNRGSSFQRNDGTIFFGSLNGIVEFHPDDFKDNNDYDVALKISKCEKYAPKDKKVIDITSQVLQEQSITIHPNEPFLTLQVSLQDFFNTDMLRYAYQIKGFQDHFSISKDNKISLSGLPYGKYQLIIKGQAQDKRFSSSEINLPIIVKRPFYLTWWFLLLTIGIILILVRQAIILRTKSLEDRRMLLEKEVKDRTTQLRSQAKQLEEQAEELRSLDEMKSRFFANISHELRTPLTLIISPTNRILNKESVNNRVYTYTQVIKQNAEKLLKRINEILELTKLDAKKVKLNAYPTHFYLFTKRLAASFESLAQQKEQHLSFDYRLDKELQILLDQDKFEHIFNNYVSNAIKYTAHKGQISIRLFEKKSDQIDTKNQIILEVEDNGQGIHPNDQKRVFERFYQTRETENKQGSSGIGLALTKEVATLMEGNVYVKSEVGNGSTFTFKMPFEEYLGVILQPQTTVQTSTDEGTIATLAASENNTNLPKLLLVEDNPQLRNYLEIVLSENYQIVSTKNGQEALDQLNMDNQYQLIISDIMMPIMDGFELLERVKQHELYRNIPFIILTARAEMKDKLKALRIGVDDYLLKPFQEEELIARIENLLNNLEERQSFKHSIEPVADVENAISDVPKISNKDAKWLESLEQTVSKEVNNTLLSVDYLAELLFINRNTLYKKVKQLTGLTPNQYIRVIKLQTAKQILENKTHFTVKDVAHEVGFQNIGHFTKLFKKEFGKTPSEYL